MTDAASKQPADATAPANPLVSPVLSTSNTPLTSRRPLAPRWKTWLRRRRPPSQPRDRTVSRRWHERHRKRGPGATGGQPRRRQTPAPRLKAYALRVRDAAAAYQHCVEKGAWPIVPRVGAMELNIPGICGVGDSIIYFVDRYQGILNLRRRFQEASVCCRCAFGGCWHAFLRHCAVHRRKALREWVDFYRELFSFWCYRRASTSACAQGYLCWKARASGSICSWSTARTGCCAGLAGTVDPGWVRRPGHHGTGCPAADTRRQFCRERFGAYQ